MTELSTTAELSTGPGQPSALYGIVESVNRILNGRAVVVMWENGAAGTPPPSGVPVFVPIRAGGGRHRMRRALRRRRRAVVAGLAMTAAALAAAGPRGEARAVRTERAHTRPEPGGTVSAPVRIADAAAVRLLRPGDLVDVLAGARVVAAGAPVVSVPDMSDTSGAADSGDEGALVVLSVPRETARALAGAATSTTPLAVTMPAPGSGPSHAYR